MIVFVFVEQAGRWHWEARVDGDRIAGGRYCESITEAESTLLPIVGASAANGATIVVEHR